MSHDYAVDAETHDKTVDALLIATSKLDAAERLNAELFKALEDLLEATTDSQGHGEVVFRAADVLHKAREANNTRLAVQGWASINPTDNPRAR